MPVVTYDFDGFNEAQTLDVTPVTGSIEITGLSNGGFVGVGDVGGTLTGMIFDVNGVRTGTFAPNIGVNGSIDQLGNGNLVIASENGGILSIKIVNSVTGADVVASFAGLTGVEPDVMALSGGGFAITSHSPSGGGNGVYLDIYDGSGTFIASNTVDANGDDSRNPSITQLAGGHIVVAWTRTVGGETEVWQKIINAAGADVFGPALVDTAGTVNQHVSVTALQGSGYALVYEDNEFSGANVNITLATFDATGASTNKFNIAQTGTIDIEPSVTLLANGLLAVCSNRADGGLAFIKLVDPATGAVLAERDVIGGPIGGTVEDTVAAVFGVGRIAVFYNDVTGSLSYGSALNVVRHSVVNLNSAETVTGDDFIDDITGGNQGDTLSGGNNNDSINGGFGNDTINGDAGDDVINGGIDQDTLNGGAGNDLIFANRDGIGFSGGDTMHGDAGDDSLIGSFSDDFMFGDGDNDFLQGGFGNDTVDGGAGTDTASFAEIIDGVVVTLTDLLAGHTGGSGSNIFGEFTTLIDIENITGSAFADTLTGNNLANTLVGGGGIDAMSGGAGDDRYFVDNASDAVSELAGSGAGFDSIFATVNYTIAANVERLFLQGTAISATGRDTQNDYLYGNALNNILDGKTGTDNLNGGLGNDSYYVNTSGDVINETIGGGTLDTIFAQTSYTNAANVERLFLLNGGNYNANGRNAQNDFLAGNDGANIINGLSGNDTIRGGLGNDTLTGGAGLDTFQFLTAPNTATNRDIITDFNVADDTIQLDNFVYTLLGANGALAANLFKNLLTAQDADDRILYDQANGNIYYDSNGLTAGGVLHFAEVTNGLALTNLDFVVV